MQTSSVTVLALDDLSARQLGALWRLAVSDWQVAFGGTFDSSIDEIHAGPRESIRGLAVLRDAAPIGLVVLKRPPLSPAWASKDTITLHGLKIGLPWQGKGFGRAAFAGALACGRSLWPDARQLALSVDADNAAALSLYRSFDMTDSGPVFQGRIGLEHRLRLVLD